MIRGAIYALALILGTYLLVTLLEYFGRFNIAMRTFLFWAFIAAASFVLVRFFVIPMTKMLRLGSTISHEKAAEIIGNHFPNVQDKLLNTLQLKNLNQGAEDNSLIEASISQKMRDLRPVPFSSAIDLRENRRYLKWVLPPLAIIVVLLFAAPSILTKPTERLIRHGQIIAEEAPFTIAVKNENLTTAENTDFKVNIEISGREIPDKVYLVNDNERFLLNRESPVNFSYTFKKVNEDVSFAFSAGGYFSDQYELRVIPAPRLVDFKIELNYPTYVKRVDEKISNTGDILVPQGTQINWNFFTRNTDYLNLTVADSTYVLPGSSDKSSFNMTAVNSLEYTIQTANQYIRSGDSIQYRIQVIPDLHPMIAAREERDSTSFSWLYFTGEVKDDYGFRRLTFNYRFTFREDGTQENVLKTTEIPVSNENTSDEFFHSWDLSEIGVKPGDKIEYYFEIWDNDGFNGSKSATTGLREYAVPTEEEIDENIDKQNENIKEKLEESIDEAKQLEKQLEELQRQLLDKKEMNWQDKKKLEELLKRQEELQKQVEEIQKNNEEKNQKQNEFNKPNESLLEKQKQLEQLMNEVMTPELEKLMEEMQRLMEELNKEEIQKELEKMDLSNEDLEKELDRALEQFKQMEWEQKMEKTIDKLEKLAEEQEKLGEESEQKNSDSKELKEKQDELNKEFDKLQEEMKELEKLNEELENPNAMPDTEPQQEEIDHEKEKSSD